MTIWHVVIGAQVGFSHNAGAARRQMNNVGIEKGGHLGDGGQICNTRAPDLSPLLLSPVRRQSTCGQRFSGSGVASQILAALPDAPPNSQWPSGLNATG